MSSLFDDADEKTLVSADFAAEVIGELRRAFDAAQRERGLMQSEVASRLGVSTSVLQRWLRGDENMTIRMLGELAWALQCVSTFRLEAAPQERRQPKAKTRTQPAIPEPSES